MSLTDFLLARIAEDEAWAHEAGGEWWYPTEVPGSTMRKHEDEPTCIIIDSPKTLISYEVVSDAVAQHIARHNPARVLAECEAKRRIVDLLNPHDDEQLLCLLALPYADHPDYDPDWRP